MIGTVLHDRWRILSALGKGGMGEVWLAEHLTSGRKEALKILMPHAALDPQFVSRFRREARAVNRLRHPNIVALYDFGQLPDRRFYLAMELADGPSVFEVLRKQRQFEVPFALHLLGQLAYALHHAHSRGVVHRDLKPGNLMITGEDATLKVLDFGMAKIVGGDADESMALSTGNLIWGTAKYMSPERVTGVSDDPRIDLYAIGCIAFELLVGQAPFLGTSNDVLHAHMTQPPPIPSMRRPGLPPELDAVILRCLEKQPEHRFANAADLFAALRKVPGYPPPKSDGRRRFVPIERRPTTLATTTEPSDGYHNLRGALRQVAEALLDQGLDDTALVSGVAYLRDHERSLARLEAAQDALEHEAAAVRETAGDREVSLRFAIGELRFAMSGQVEPEDQQKIDELEARLATAVAEADRVRAIELGITEVVKVRGEELDRLKSAYASLEAAVDDVLADHVETPTLEPLLERLRDLRKHRTSR
ncbi:MAG: bifunctional serine/threonine-protein kinase/ABC transporter substrate-binding protein [Kofleriaceae bacterium]